MPVGPRPALLSACSMPSPLHTRFCTKAHRSLDVCSHASSFFRSSVSVFHKPLRSCCWRESKMQTPELSSRGTILRKPLVIPTRAVSSTLQSMRSGISAASPYCGCIAILLLIGTEWRLSHLRLPPAALSVLVLDTGRSPLRGRAVVLLCLPYSLYIMHSETLVIREVQGGSILLLTSGLNPDRKGAPHSSHQVPSKNSC